MNEPITLIPILDLAKRLADYCRLTIELGDLNSDSPIGIAYKDFMQEWDKYHSKIKQNNAELICPVLFKERIESGENKPFFCPVKKY